jgi:hypothetical protein
VVICGWKPLYQKAVVKQPQISFDRIFNVVHTCLMRTEEGLKRRREQQKQAAERRRRNAGIALRTKLSAEQERERNRQYCLARHRDPAARERDNAQRRIYLSKKRSDPQFRLLANMRSRVSNAVRKSFPKPDKTLNALGCTFGELKVWLETHFEDGMTWENYGRGGWHLDHVREICTFDLSDPVQFSECCHYTNLQPLWEGDNLAKEHRRRAVDRGGPLTD